MSLTGQERYRIEQTLADAFRGLHHAGKFRHLDGYTETNVYAGRMSTGRTSTFDFDTLTRLVFAAHDWCVRVELDDSSPRMVKLRLHPRRARRGETYARHPTLREAVDKWRDQHDIEDGLEGDSTEVPA